MSGGLVGEKDIFLRLVFFHLVEVYFHEAIKIKIGEHRLVQIIERAIPFLRVESIIHHLGDSAVLQIGVHLNDVLLILGSGIAQIDSCQVGKVRLGDFEFVLAGLILCRRCATILVNGALRHAAPLWY